MRRPLVVLSIVGLVLVAGLVIAHRNAPRPVPAPIWRAPYDPALTYKMVTFYQGRVQMNPRNGAIEWAQLAGAYLQRCRETGDIADALRAEQAARRSISIRSGHNQNAFNQLGLTLFTQHRFPEAQALAAKQMARYPDDAQACLLYAETSLERGDYDATERALQKQPDGSQLDGVQAKGARSPSVLAVQARLLDVNGHPQAALQVLRQAQTEADGNMDMPRENVAWFHMRVGDQLARMGRIDDAERSYQEALALFPRDYKTLTGLTRLAAGRQDWTGTISWGQKAMAIVPAPEAVILVGDAYAAQGKTKEAEQQYRLIEAMGTLARAQRIVYDRYRARFDADHGRHLAEALALSRRELTVRHDIYAYDTLAWACLKNGLVAQAGAAMQKAMAHNTQDALLFYHAGRIAAAQGDQAQAKADLDHATVLDPFFQPAAPDVTQHPFGGF